MQDPLITISEFARLIGYSYKSALEVSRQKALIERNIAVQIKPGLKKGGVRINYSKYLEYLNACPAVSEAKYVQKRKYDRKKVVQLHDQLLA